MASRGRTEASKRERVGNAFLRGYQRVVHSILPSSPSSQHFDSNTPPVDARYTPSPSTITGPQTSAHLSLTQGTDTSGKRTKTTGFKLSNNAVPNATGDTPAANPEPATCEQPDDGGRGILGGLETALCVLGASTNAFPPLKSAVGGLIACLDIVQSAVANAEDYNRLTSELTTMATSLNKYITELGQDDGDAIIQSIARQPYRSIETEVVRINKNQERGTGRRLAETTKDKEDVITSYHIIESLFRQLQTDINLRVLGNTNKLTDINLQILGNTSRLLPQRVSSLLQGMSPVDDARYDSGYSTTVKRRACTPETREKVQLDLQDWVRDPNGANVYWMNGMAGTGKTTIAYSLCEWLEANKQLGASFFCSRVSSSCRNVNLIVPTIACQLARRYSVYQSALCEVLEVDPEIGKLNVVRQFERLVRDPLAKLKDGTLGGAVVVIDALDECDDEYGVRLIIGTLLKLGASLPLRFFVTSRPEPAICDGMMSPGGYSPAVLHLHDIEQSIVEGDIKKYLDSELELASIAPSKVGQLAKRAGNLFIYAATAVRYILSGRGSPVDRLSAMLANDSHPTQKAQYVKKYKELDGLYTTILEAALKDERLEEVEAVYMRLVLWTVICTKEPLAIPALASLVGLAETQVTSSLKSLYSVLHVSGSQGLVSTLHASFPDYMLDGQRSQDLCCNEVQHSAFLAGRCFNVMKNELRFNICGLKSSSELDQDVPGLDHQISTQISATLSYACHYWGQHLQQSGASNEHGANLLDFVTYRLLFWMEVMNLKRAVAKAISVLMDAENWELINGTSVVLRQWISDARDFVSRFAAGACNRSTPHIYLSALPFCARSSLVYAHYWGRTRGLMDVRGTAISQRDRAAQATWTTSDFALSVAFSPDGTRIAAGCQDCHIWVWEAHTGDLVAGPLDGHTCPVNSIAFSPDSTRLASGSGDSTIQVWDTRTGSALAGPFEGHISPVNSVAYSHDGTRIVSGSEDKTILVWDASTGDIVSGPLEGHEGGVTSVAFSPDGIYIASASTDMTIRVWNAQTRGLVFEPLTGHSNSVKSVAFSPDGALIVSGSADRTIRIWDAPTGNLIIGPLKSHTGAVASVAFSPDGTRIVSGSYDETSVVWDTHSGNIVAGPFRGHTGLIDSTTFSPDGTRVVTGSRDSTIRVWDTRLGVAAEAISTRGHASFVASVAFSPDGTLIASGSSDTTVRIWDAHAGHSVVRPLEGHTYSIRSLAFSPSGTHVVSGADDATVRVWDIRSGDPIAGPFEGHSAPVNCVAFSPNGTRVVSGSDDETIRVWDSSSGHIVAGPLGGHTDNVMCVAFSPDGMRIVSGSDDATIRVWDARTGDTIAAPFEGSITPVRSVVFSPDGGRIVSCSRRGDVRVWDARTGKLVEGPFEGYTGWVNSAMFLPGGVRVVSNRKPSETAILVWDAQTGEIVAGPFNGHTRAINSLAFSPDGTCIVSGSSDQAIRVSFYLPSAIVNMPYFKLLRSTTTTSSNTAVAPKSDPRESSGSLSTTSPDALSPRNPHDHSLDEALTRIVDFDCQEDGWVTSGGVRLFWTPPDLRAHIPFPQDRVVIGHQGSMYINYENLLLGEKWAECYKP